MKSKSGRSKKRIAYFPLMLAVVIVWTSSCASRNDGKLHVAAAASLAPAFLELSHVFMDTTGEEIVLTFSSTGALAEQIRNGAPFDVFASADEEHIDALVSGGYLLPNSKVLFASGSLVLLFSLEHENDVMELSDLRRAEIRRIAIANPELAPYGIAARQILIEAGLWEVLQPKIIMGETVGQAYIFVTSGNADAGIVARSVLTAESKALPTVQLSTDKPPQHWAAIVAQSDQLPLAESFLTFLTSPAARQVFDDFGFQQAGVEP